MSTLFDAFQRFDISDDAFIAGPARLLWAGITVADPDEIGDVVNMSNFDPQTGWNDLGATKTGAAVTRNFTEQTYTIDQSFTDIRSRPTSWEMALQTALAEMTLERIQFAWEGGPITTNAGPNERKLGLGAPRKYTQRKLAVIHIRDNDKVRMFFLRKTNISPQETSLQWQREGDQQTLPMRFRAFADSSSVESERFGYILDQV